ncbi:MAG: hypothetical protein WCY09_01995 [Candidatus Omnitrophota bacterium]
MQILVVLSVGMVIYAVFTIYVSGKSRNKNKKNENSQPALEDPGKEQKIQRLQSRVTELENQLKKNKEEFLQGESVFNRAKGNEAKLLDELKRREDWVAKAEAELAKIKLENSDLTNKFLIKEGDLETEFTNNVNLTRTLNEMKLAFTEKEIAVRLKEDQIQSLKQQVQEQLKVINEQVIAIAEFNKKEKINEWVPKLEFNKLNQEYTQLENKLEASQERLKRFAEEIARFRHEAGKKTSFVGGAQEGKVEKTL